MVLDLSCAHSNKLIIVILGQLPWLQLEVASFFIIYLFMGPTITALSSFDDVMASMLIRHAYSMSSLKNGKIETESVFFYYFNGCLFCCLNFYPICSDILPLLSHPAKPSKHRPSSCLQKCPRDLVSTFSSRLFCFPIDNFQWKCQIFEIAFEL